MSEQHPIPKHAFIFHMGSLGDGIVHWPLYRAMCRVGWNITLVGEDSRTALAAAEVTASIALNPATTPPQTTGEREGQIRAQSCELPSFRNLWCAECAPANIKPDVKLVIAMFEDARWLTGAKAMFAAARLVCHAALGYQPNSALWQEFEVAKLGQVAPRQRSGSAIVMHLGAGAEAKRWPMHNFEQLQKLLTAEAFTNPLLQRTDGSPLPVHPIFGEVELARFTDTDHATFARMCRFANPSHVPIAGLSKLASTIRLASIFIGCDTGPTHLAAQLGVPTVALYSADQTDNWLPRGPMVRVVRPQRGGVENITPREVLDSVLVLRGNTAN